jgi:hypothetical protein
MKIAEEDSGAVREKVTATFKSSRIINIQTNETVKRRTLDFRVAHRFGNIGDDYETAFHNFYGLDASADIRIAFEYGITDALTIGLSRSKILENLEGLVKYRLLQQVKGKIPVAITLFANTAFTPRNDPGGYYEERNDEGNIERKPLRRLSYTSQLIIARKFSPHFSFLVAPTVIHHNFVENPLDDNTKYAVGVGGRVKVTRSMAIVADYFYNLSDLREINNDYGFYNPLGAGVEFETGGHVFSIMFTNAAAIIENEFITHTTDSWTDGGYKFSFNISRNFRL